MKLLKQLILAVTLLISASAASAQATGTCSTLGLITTCNYGISDDSYAIVPIPFGFPYYGRVFTHSIFFDNGLVSFYDPQTEAMRLGGQNFFAQPLSDNIGSNFHYSIMPLWSDLRNYSGSYFTETDGQGFLRYNWENISQFGYPDRLNTFSLEIQPSGFIGINYQQINISGYPVTAGLMGNASLGEWQQHFYAPSSQPVTTGSVPNWSITETIPTDCSDPLVNVNCPGYQQAFLQQQCSIDALYSPACPGYAEAYTQWQISVRTSDPTAFNGQCQTLTPSVWFDYQCSLDPLYDKDCDGYAQAFLSQYGSSQTSEVKTEVTEEPEVLVETTATTSTSTTDNPAAAVSLTTQSTTTTQPAPAPAARTEPTARTAPTARQALAERRAAAAAAQAAQRAKDNPDETASAMDNADSLEQQAEMQNAVVGAMSFVPGFDAYGRVTIPDAVGYKPFEIYSGQRNIDTPAARGLLGRSDILHQEMVNEQYR
jgi:hypothetical protein